MYHQEKIENRKLRRELNRLFDNKDSFETNEVRMQSWKETLKIIKAVAMGWVVAATFAVTAIYLT